MRLLIYGDIGGSGGYVRYCKGLLASKAIPKDIEAWFVTTPQFYEKLKPLDSEVHVITHPWMISNHKALRLLWHLWVYPKIVKKVKPAAEFYPSGNLRVFLRKALSITTCHNLLLFDKKELEKIEDTAEKEYFFRSRKVQSESFRKSNATIFLSKHSQQVVTKEVGGIRISTVIAHGLDREFILPNNRSYDLGETINILYISPF